MEELKAVVLADLMIELGIVSGTNEATVLSSKISSSIKEIQMLRNYPKTYTQENIIGDLTRHYSNIRELSLYDYNQIGVEGQTSHNENNVNRQWKNRTECLRGIVAFCS